MHLIEILLPLRTDERFREAVASVSTLLTEKFGGLTAFTRTPGEGFWVDGGATERDDIAVLEVMTEALERDWWRLFRKELEERFGQKEIVIRAHVIEKL